MSLTCQLVGDRSLPPIELVWGLPSDHPPPKDRLFIEDQIKTKLNSTPPNDIEHLIISKTLHISSLNTSDEGVYTCKSVISIPDSNEESAEQKYLLDNIMLDPDQPFIGELDFQGHPVIDVVRRDLNSVRWVFKIQVRAISPKCIIAKAK